MIVRQAQSRELDSTVILFNYYRDEAIESIPRIADEYDEDSMIATIRTYISNHEYIWLNAMEGQRPVGFIGGVLTPCPWNDQLIAAHISFVYLLPSHRNLDNFKQLMTAFEEWARTCHCYQITGGDIGINIERSTKLYEHFGFTPMLHTYKEIVE
jgi:GNAT superfamily N-acetyltransferase